MFSEVCRVVNADAAKVILGKNGRRHGLKDQSINDLLERIRREGQLMPCLAWQDDKDRYHIIVGYRRLKACIELGIPVQLKIVERPDEEKEIDQNFDENMGRKQLSSAEIAEYAIHKHDKGMPNAVIATRIGCTSNYVSMLLWIAKLIEAGKELLHNGKMGVARAILIAKMSRPEQLVACKAIDDNCSLLPDELDPQLGDNSGVSRPDASMNDEGETGEKATAPDTKPPQRTVPLGLKEVKELLVKIIARDQTNEGASDCCKVLLAFCLKTLDADDVVKAMVSSANAKKAIASIERKEERKAAEEEKAKESAKQIREDAAEAAVEKKAEASKAAIARLEKAGWTHVKDNTNRWSAPGEKSKVKLTLAEALMTAFPG